MPAGGAWVIARVAGRDLVRTVRAGGSYLAQNDPRIRVGLGSAERPEAVTIHWGAGQSHELTDLTPGRYHRIDLPPGAADAPEPGAQALLPAAD